MGKTRRWFNKVQRKLLRLPTTNTVVLHSNTSPGLDKAKSGKITEHLPDYERLNTESTKYSTGELTREDMAAIKIQSIFRGHLARRAFQALRSLVKLQALVRGVYVRKQSRIALHCMHALVRLQVRVRARQLLSTRNDD